MHSFKGFNSCKCLHPSVLQHLQLADKNLGLLPVFLQVMLKRHQFALIHRLHRICQNPVTPLLVYWIE